MTGVLSHHIATVTELQNIFLICDYVSTFKSHFLVCKYVYIKMLIFLSEDLVALGGFKQKGRDDMEPLLPETEQILERCKRLVPSLKVRLQCVIVIFPQWWIQRGTGPHDPLEHHK